MPTLLEVKGAIQAGDKQRANQLLKQVMKEKPSAEAWYLAAQLSSNESSKIKYLKQAINIDPNHRKARDYLHELGETHKGLVGNTLEDAGVYHFIDELRYRLGNMSVSQRLTVVGLSTFLFVVIIGLVLSNITGGGKSEVFIPTVEAMQYKTGAGIGDHFIASDLVVDSVTTPAPPEGLSPTSYTVMNIRNSDDTLYQIQVLVYPTYLAIGEQASALNNHIAANQVKVVKNSVLIYPANTPQTLADLITQTFTSIPNS